VTRSPSPRISFALAIITIGAAGSALALMAAGCGGGGSPGAGNATSSTTAATTTSTTAATTTVQYGTNGALAGALAFARCMRAHGIPTPDPEPNGAFDKHKLQRLLGGISLSRVRAVEERSCRYDFEPGGQPQGHAIITPADRADYLKGARCMRSHGVPDFPDPTFQQNTVTFNIPPSIDTNASRFKRAAATCINLIPAGLPYSNRRAP
jgi:hypothetical protein